MSISIRKLSDDDKAAWQVLWQGYLEYYRSELPETITDLTWSRILGSDGGIYGLGAFDENDDLVGIVHYLFHPVTWSAEPRCYLDDLFTSKAARGQGAGRALIAAVADAARAKNCEQVYWVTEDYNKRAQGLYNKVAEKTPFIKYQITL